MDSIKLHLTANVAPLLGTSGQIVLQGAIDYIDAIVHRLEKDRNLLEIESEQQLFNINEQLASTSNQLAELTTVNADLRRHLSQFETERNDRMAKFHHMEAERDELTTERDKWRRNAENLLCTKQEMDELLERRNEELKQLTADLKSAQENAKRLVMEKCTLQNDFEELKSQEMSVNFHEKRWEQERELLTNEKDWYSSELQLREQKLLALRKEITMKELDQRVALDTKDEEIKQLRSEVEHNKERLSSFDEQVEDLTKRLKEAADMRLSLQESFEKELQCQAQLSNVYKCSAEEAETKVEELTKALESVQQLFDDAKSNHFLMQEEIKLNKEQSDAIVASKEREIEELKDELIKANELLHSKNRVLLTEEELAVLSPSAAAASRLMKGDLTLSQIYKNHCTVVEQLEASKSENRRLEAYLKEIVQNVESKAPLFRKQRDEYREAVKIIASLKAQLDQTGSEHTRIQQEKDNVFRQLTYTKAELDRYQRDNRDLSSQVRQLTICIEEMRRGGVADSTSGPSDDIALFRNVDELQAKNQQLLSALREAEVRRDELVKAAQEAEMAKVRRDLDNAQQELEDLKVHRHRQNEVIDAVSKARDTYKELLKKYQKESPSAAEFAVLTPSKDQVGATESSTATDAMIERINRETETYRREKQETEKFLNEKIERLETALADYRSKHAKASADLEYQQERFKILQGNTESYKKEIKNLRDKGEKTATTIAKYEQSVAHVTQELIASRDELTRVRLENQRLNDQFQQARSAEQRLSQENQILKRNAHQQQMLSSTLQEIQARLERTDAEDTLKLRNELQLTTKERDNMQQTLQKMTEQHGEYLRTYREKLENLQNEFDAVKAKCTSLERELSWTKDRHMEAQQKREELEATVGRLQASVGDARFEKDSQQLQTRLNYVELRFTEANNKITELTEQLKRSRAETEQYKVVSENLESSLAELKEAESSKMAELTNSLAQASEALTAREATIDGLRAELSAINAQLVASQALDSEHESTSASRIQALEMSLIETQRAVSDWQNRAQEACADRDRQTELLVQAQEQYDLGAHQSMDLTAEVNSLRERAISAEQRLADTQAGFDNVSLVLEEERRQWLEKERQIVADADMRAADLEALRQHNERLQEEMLKLGTQVSVLERVSSGRAAGEQTFSESAEMPDSTLLRSVEEQSVSSMIEVVKFLRVEKQNASQRMAVAEEESQRARARVQVVEKEMLTLRQQLSEAQSEAEVANALAVERTGLLAKLERMEELEKANESLHEDLQELDRRIQDADAKLTFSEELLATEKAEKLSQTIELNQLQSDLSEAKQEMERWRTRHDQLVDERTRFDPQETQRLRLEVGTLREKASAAQAQINKANEASARQAAEIEALNNTVLNNSTEFTKEKDALSAQLAETQTALEASRKEAVQTANTLGQARKLALKYKNLYEQLQTQAQTQQAAPDQRIQELEAALKDRDEKLGSVPHEIEEIMQMVDQLEKQKAELETKLQSRDAEVADLNKKLAEKKPVAPVQVPSSQVFAQASADNERLKNSLKAAGEQILNLTSEKDRLLGIVGALEQRKTELDQAADEQRCRLDSLTSLHALCDLKTKKLTDRLEELERVVEEKAALERQVAEMRAKAFSQSGKQVAAPPPAVRARPSAITHARPVLIHRAPTASIRPIAEETSNNVQQRVASIRPLGHSKTTATVAPQHSLNVPDQSTSTSASGSAAVQQVTAAVSPMVTSTQAASSTTAAASILQVPQAVVSPRFETQEAVIASSDGSQGSAISSSVVLSVEPPNPFEIATSSDNGGGGRKRPQSANFSEMGAFGKRRRSQSPGELVSTSDQSNSQQQQPLGDSDVDSARMTGMDSTGEAVGSSSQEDLTTDEEIFVLDDDLAPDVGSTGSEALMAFNEANILDPFSRPTTLSSRLGAAPRTFGTFQPVKRSVNEHFVDQDDGCVPSTPTLVTASSRALPDVASPHVPQARFFGSFGDRDLGFGFGGFTTSNAESSTSSVADTASEVGAVQRSVPSTTPRHSPMQEAASSTLGGDVSEFDEPPSSEFHMPGGQQVSDDDLLVLGNEANSDANAGESDGGESDDGEDSNEPTTSTQPKTAVRLVRRPIVWDGSEVAAETAEDATSSSPGYGRPTRGRQIARRARPSRGGTGATRLRRFPRRE